MTMREQVNFAVSDLSGRSGVAPGQIQMLQGGSVQWRSGALGCPEPGQFYTEALVPGVLLTLGVDGKVYHYHATRGGQPFLCPDARRQPPVSGGALD